MEQEKQEAPVQQKKKRLSTPLLIFIILMAVTAVLCAVVAGIWLHGRSSLRNGGSAPTVTPGGTEQPERFGVFGAVPRGGNGLREPSGFAVVGGKFGRALIRAEQRLHGQEGHVHGRAPSRHSGEPDVPGSHALRG